MYITSDMLYQLLHSGIRCHTEQGTGFRIFIAENPSVSPGLKGQEKEDST